MKMTAHRPKGLHRSTTTFFRLLLRCCLSLSLICCGIGHSLCSPSFILFFLLSSPLARLLARLLGRGLHSFVRSVSRLYHARGVAVVTHTYAHHGGYCQAYQRSQAAGGGDEGGHPPESRGDHRDPESCCWDARRLSGGGDNNGTVSDGTTIAKGAPSVRFVDHRVVAVFFGRAGNQRLRQESTQLRLELRLHATDHFQRKRRASRILRLLGRSEAKMSSAVHFGH